MKARVLFVVLAVFLLATGCASAPRRLFRGRTTRN